MIGVRPAGARPGGSRSCERGLITLEWLLIVAAISGLAAFTVLIVQRMVDSAADIPDDPATRLIDADVAAAMIAAEATATRLDPDYVESVFGARCDDLETSFADVVDNTTWAPATITGSPPEVDEPAKCEVTPRDLS